jgi:glycolate oxidase
VAVELVCALGGHLTRQLGPDVMELTRAVKAALDPTGVLNPGKWV